MSDIQYKAGDNIQSPELLNLYNDAGWANYTEDPDKLMGAVQNSLFTVTARDGDQLAGFLRAIGDGLTIVYIQDILVLQKYRRQGIGRELLRIALERYASVRQIVLLTDKTQETKGFYENAGMKKAEELDLQAFVRIKN